MLSFLYYKPLLLGPFDDLVWFWDFVFTCLAHYSPLSFLSPGPTMRMAFLRGV